ncbi:ABC transporter ATP-binding protein [Alkalicoccus halolimnae]|uniref:ABC transporter ATP-binding protein n=1 Tax=Alkalicoccus halolimnae TaxID=1667239 RepID=A0A5C7FG38_9BACI|nr:ABC transporter ATP-binding protein [Alkalicoccus halolimnae]TXF81973.1 ABC transporter ATP-binding protein [Alkalicoccus halolimnae]
MQVLNEVHLSGLKKSYMRQAALNGIDLHMKGPGMIGIVGPNGSGKSTLLKLMAGLIRPSSGQVKINNERITRRSGETTAFLSEDDSLYRFLTVSKTLQFFHETVPEFDLTKAERMVTELKLPLDRKVKHLSKGNRARLKIVVTLARSVPVLCMDEPLSGLDPLVRQDILKMIIRYADIENQLVFLSTHEVEEVEPFLDQVIIIQDGEVALFGEVETLRQERGMTVTELMREVLA